MTCIVTCNKLHNNNNGIICIICVTLIHIEIRHVFLLFHITRARNLRQAPADPRHGAWCTTPGAFARARGHDDGSTGQ